jgi:hypothetical protein
VVIGAEDIRVAVSQGYLLDRACIRFECPALCSSFLERTTRSIRIRGTARSKSGKN